MAQSQLEKDIDAYVIENDNHLPFFFLSAGKRNYFLGEFPDQNLRVIKPWLDKIMCEGNLSSTYISVATTKKGNRAFIAHG